MLWYTSEAFLVYTWQEKSNFLLSLYLTRSKNPPLWRFCAWIAIVVKWGSLRSDYRVRFSNIVTLSRLNTPSTFHRARWRSERASARRRITWPFSRWWHRLSFILDLQSLLGRVLRVNGEIICVNIILQSSIIYGVDKL